MMTKEVIIPLSALMKLSWSILSSFGHYTYEGCRQTGDSPAEINKNYKRFRKLKLGGKLERIGFV